MGKIYDKVNLFLFFLGTTNFLDFEMDGITGQQDSAQVKLDSNQIRVIVNYFRVFSILKRDMKKLNLYQVESQLLTFINEILLYKLNQYEVELKLKYNQHLFNEEISRSQENSDPTMMDARKKRKSCKKTHNLSKNIAENKSN